MELYIFALLALLLVFQHIYYSYVVNKLINKLMSRNYGEYEASKPARENLKVKLNQGVPEDLSYLDGLNAAIR